MEPYEKILITRLTEVTSEYNRVLHEELYHYNDPKPSNLLGSVQETATNLKAEISKIKREFKEL